jgi:hypothetical protein
MLFFFKRGERGIRRALLSPSASAATAQARKLSGRLNKGDDQNQPPPPPALRAAAAVAPAGPETVALRQRVYNFATARNWQQVRKPMLLVVKQTCTCLIVLPDVSFHDILNWTCRRFWML